MERSLASKGAAEQWGRADARPAPWFGPPRKASPQSVGKKSAVRHQ